MSNGSDDWFNLPRPAQGIKLYQIREEMRQKNLADTEEPPLETSTSPPAGDVYNVRTSDGTYNDLKCPRMGSTGMRFGRNVPLSEAFPDTANLLKPSPRQVSLELLTRTTFQPATILNVIAAAWIQFMVHDWFMHKKGAWTHTHDIPVDDGDTWHERPMRVPKTPADPPKVAGSMGRSNSTSNLEKTGEPLVAAGFRRSPVRLTGPMVDFTMRGPAAKLGPMRTGDYPAIRSISAPQRLSLSSSRSKPRSRW